jgi:hypothetical protein
VLWLDILLPLMVIARAQEACAAVNTVCQRSGPFELIDISPVGFARISDQHDLWKGAHD